MSTPTMTSAPAPGNLLSSQSLAASSNIGAYKDASTLFESQITARDTTGSAAASTSGVAMNIYAAYAAPTTTTGTTTNNGTGLSVLGTSVTVASVTGIAVGSLIAIDNEVVTVSAISGNTLTISAVKRAHANGVNVYLIPSTPPIVGATLGQNTTAANTTYSQMIPVNTGRWYISLANTDATNAVTVELTSNDVTGIA